MAVMRAVLASLLIIVLGSTAVNSTASGLTHNTGVCNIMRSRLSSSTVYRRTYYTVSQRSTYGCGFLWLSRCSRYRTRYVYYSVSSASYYVTYYTSSQCCSGYLRNVFGRCIPQCQQGCVYGSCTSPGVCSCNSGWTGNSCQTDVNECSYKWCSHYCVNTQGSYYCYCQDNYYLAYDRHSCIDSDECTNGQVTIGQLNSSNISGSTLPRDWCEQKCNNTPGDYMCECYDGYQLDDNNQTCTDTDECIVDNGGCNQTCINTLGSFNCSCNNGFILLEDGVSCADHCECCSDDDDCEHMCHNTVGSYYCSCRPGYRLSSTNSSACKDINECSEGISDCVQVCVNLIGRFECTCQSGYTLLTDGRSCEDINECTTNNGGCDHTCINTNGTRYCQCRHGYMIDSDGLTCLDIDECTINSSNCSQTCSNHMGGYSCGCHTGYDLSRDNITCNDVNECLNSNGRCQQICDNIPGSFNCQCNSGYTKNGFSCIARNCPFLTSPTNGQMSCTGQQVTDQNCTFWCDPGYTLTGASVRTCLGLTQSWSGERAQCERSLCPVLTATEVMLVLYPCNNKYEDSCQLLCETGYNANGDVSWLRTCNATSNSSSVVDWDMDRTCRARDLCEPNPCSPGQCSVDEGGKGIRCDCKGTYTTGERCQLSQIVIDPIPVLTQGSQYTTRVSSWLAAPSKILVSSLDNISLAIVSSPLLTLHTQPTSYTVQANQLGFFKVRYDVMPGAPLVKASDSLYLVTSTRTARDTAQDYFMLQGLERGHLGIGCCQRQLTLTPYQCTSNITLHSYCQWNTNSSTEGVIYLSVSSLYLPLSIAGLKVNGFNTYTSANTSNQCMSCDRMSNTKCQKADSSLHFNTKTIHDILQYRSMVTTFLVSVKKFLPIWLQVEVYTSTLPSSYSIYDFKSFIGTVRELKTIIGCEDIHLKDTPSLVYALRTTSRLLFTIDSHPVFLYPTTNNPFCIVIDTCSGITPTLHTSIPPTLLNRQNAAATSTLRSLYTGNTRITFKSIALQEDGLVSPMETRTQYWNGSQYFSPSLPLYQYQVEVAFHKTFTSEGGLSVAVDYEGLVYYQPAVKNGEVPGLLVGKLNLNITTVINQRTVSLILTSDNLPVLFTYPTRVPLQSALPIGISAALRYVTETSGTFYSEHFFLPTPNCLIMTFISLDTSMNVNNVSFTSDCVSLRLGQLHFKEGLRTTVVLSGLRNPNSLILSAYPLSAIIPYRIDNFQILASGSGPAIEVMFQRDSQRMIGALHHVNVSLLNSIFTSNVSITDYQFMFQSETKIYSDYDVRIVGSISSSNSTYAVELDGEFFDKPNSFRSDFSSYLSQHLHTEIHGVVNRTNQSIKSVQTSRAWRDHLYNRLVSTKAQLLLAEDSFMEANSSLFTVKGEVKVASEKLKVIIIDYLLYNSSSSLNMLLCNSSWCSVECRDGTGCSSYSKTVTLNVTGSCRYQALVNRVTQQVSRVSTKEWQYLIQCKTCWKIKWYRSLYLSQRSCCKWIKVPVDTYQYTLQYVNTTVNDTMERLCTVANNSEVVTSQKCREIDCLYEVTNTTCFSDKVSCYRQLVTDFEGINNTISQLYSTYLEVLLAEEAAKLDLLRKGVRMSKLREAMELLQSTYVSANSSYHNNLEANQSLLEETKVFAPFVGLFNPLLPPVQQLNVLHINNISFHVIIRNSTPVSLPINVTYLVQATGETHSINIAINFLQPRRYIFRQMSNMILESYLSIVRSLRNKRETPSESLATGHRFHDTCIELGTMRKYIVQILTSLHDSWSSFNTSRDSIINATVSVLNDTSLYGGETLSSSIATHRHSLMTELIGSYNQSMTFIKNNSFALWQAQMEAVHANFSHVEMFGCSSYLDCLGTVVNLFDHILEDTANASQALNELRELKESVYEVGYNKSMSYEGGQRVLERFLNLVTLARVLQYWCTEPPLIVSQPPPSVSVQVNSSIELTCQANSTLSVSYYWTKDNVIIANYNLSTLQLTDAHIGDEGQYRCVAVNDVGSSSSLPAVVEVTSKPVLNLTLPLSLIAYEGDNNGIDLTCDSIGRPVPGWKWFYRQTESDSWHLIVSVESNVLTLSKPQLKDRGWYQCMSYNKVGNVTSRPVYLNILSMAASSVLYSFTLTLDEITDTWVKPFVDSLVLQANLTTTVAIDGPLYSFGIGMSSISISIQTSPVNYNPSLAFNTLTAQVSSSIAQLEHDRDLLSTFLRSNSQLRFSVQRQAQIVSIVNFTVGPRHFLCSTGHQLDSDHILCVACSPGSYGSAVVTSFLDSGNGDYIQELIPQCIECPVGTYQSNGGQSLCVLCPTNTTTSKTGCRTRSECQEICPPHSFSATGLQPCILCPSLYYQMYSGQRSCLPCSNATKLDICYRPSSSSSFSLIPTTSYISTIKSPSVSVVTESTSVSTSRSPLPTAIAQEESSNFFNTTTIASIAGSVILLILITIVCVILVGLRMKKKKHQRELRGELRATYQPNPEVELNSYDAYQLKESEVQYDDVKNKLGDISEDDVLHDPIYESLDDMDKMSGERNTLWGPPPPLPPPIHTTNPIYFEVNSSTSPITDEYVSMASPKDQIKTVDYANVN